VIEVIKHGYPVPPKVWARATDLLAGYRDAGEAWMAAGRPSEGPVVDAFNKAEMEYTQAADAVFFGKWTEEQRAEWNRLWADSPTAPVNDKLQRIMSGEAVVVSDEWLDQADLPSNVATIPNPNQVGILDAHLVGRVDHPVIHKWRVENGIIQEEITPQKRLKIAL
jgi:hypothetical protein